MAEQRAPLSSASIGIPDTTDKAVLWEYFQTHNDFFKSVKIDQQAGFDELGEFYGVGRLIGLVVALASVAFNIYSILSINIPVLISDNPDDSFLLSTFLLKKMDIGDVLHRNPQRVLAIMELALVGLTFVYAGMQGIFAARAETKCARWMSIGVIVWGVLPFLQTVSLVKLLGFVAPAVLVPALLEAITRTFTSGCSTAGLHLLWILGSRFLCLVVGFDAFLFKFWVVSGEMTKVVNDDPNTSVGTVFINSAVFVNQMLGVVQVGLFVKNRIFLFIFAGEDGYLSEYENKIRTVWEAMVSSRLWMELKPLQAISVMVTFSDLDFQKMVLDTKGPKTEQSTPAEAAAEAAS